MLGTDESFLSAGKSNASPLNPRGGFDLGSSNGASFVITLSRSTSEACREALLSPRISDQRRKITDQLSTCGHLTPRSHGEDFIRAPLRQPKFSSLTVTARAQLLFPRV